MGWGACRAKRGKAPGKEVQSPKRSKATAKESATNHPGEDRCSNEDEEDDDVDETLAVQGQLERTEPREIILLDSD